MVSDVDYNQKLSQWAIQAEGWGAIYDPGGSFKPYGVVIARITAGLCSSFYSITNKIL